MPFRDLKTVKMLYVTLNKDTSACKAYVLPRFTILKLILHISKDNSISSIQCVIKFFEKHALGWAQFAQYSGSKNLNKM